MTETVSWLRKGAKPLRPKEIVLHMQVAKLLRDHCLVEWRWTHMPSGEMRNIETARKLKQMGVRRGWPDFILISPSGIAHFLELKRMGEMLNIEQQDFQTWCIQHNIPHSVAWGFRDASDVLISWNCLQIKKEMVDHDSPVECTDS